LDIWRFSLKQKEEVEKVRNRFPYCFACGKENPIGLHLEFTPKDSCVEAVFSPGFFHQGYPNIVHGGIVTTLLDEAMAYVLEFNNYRGLTARLNVKFIKALKPDEKYRVIGYLDKIRGKVIKTHAEILDEENRIIVKAYATFVGEKI
jgi:acyl-coenzyme A thioesterase PaaI-like protein